MKKELIKIIFLDFDGVLNFADFLWKNHPEWLVNHKRTDLDHMGMEICTSKVLLLNQIVETIPNLFFVVSSAWRKRAALPKLRKILFQHGFKGTLLDITPSFGKRGLEIQSWLDTKPEKNNFLVEKFVILDDDSDMEHLMPYLVHTTWEKGLEQKHVDEVIRRLK